MPVLPMLHESKKKNLKLLSRASLSVLCVLFLSACDWGKLIDKLTDVATQEKKLESLVDDVKMKTVERGEYKPDVVPEGMDVQEKKKRFKALIVPPTQRVYLDLLNQYRRVSIWVEEGSHKKEIAVLKKLYKAETDQQLLAALKPHPPSIVISQAAMESAWATSRFFLEARNIFGVWSFDKEEPRIAAGETRGKKTIWVKKYKTIEDAIRDYYRVLARGHAHQHFRDERLKTDDPYALIDKLDQYSEKRQVYVDELKSILKFNQFNEFDPVFNAEPEPAL